MTDDGAIQVGFIELPASLQRELSELVSNLVACQSIACYSWQGETNSAGGKITRFTARDNKFNLGAQDKVNWSERRLRNLNRNIADFLDGEEDKEGVASVG